MTPEARPALTDPGAWPLIGRDGELTEVRSALRDRSSRGLVVVGASGTGKTRLLDEALQIAARRFRTDRVVATESASTIAFGAFAHLLVDDPPPSGGAEALREVAAGIVGDAEGPSLLLGVDDAHHLDDPSAALLAHLARTSGVRVVCTVRKGEPTPAAVTALWKEGLCGRLELGPLGRASADAMVEAGLGAPVERAALQRIWELARGNPLFTAELGRGAVEAGNLALTDDLWRRSGPILPSERLAELIEGRLWRLDDDERTAVEVVAFGEPLEGELLAELVATQAVAALEERGFFHVTGVGRETVFRFTYPVYGEVVRSSIPRSRAMAVCVCLDDVAGRAATSEPVDPLRRTRWKHSAGRVPDPELVVEAAHRAHLDGDHALAAELARSAVDDEPFAAGLVLGLALAHGGRIDEALDVLRDTTPLAADEDQRVTGAVALADVLAFQLGRTDEALTALREVRSDATDPVRGLELDAAEADVLALLGDLTPAVELGVALGPGTDAPRALETTLLAHILRGRLQDAAVRMEAVPDAQGQIPRFQVLARAYAGDVAGAAEAAEDGYLASLEAGAPGTWGPWAALLGEMLLFRGRVGDARRAFAEADAALERSDPDAMRPVIVAAAAATEAMMGNGEAATALLDRIGPRVRWDRRVRIRADGARIWTTAREGDVAAAADLAGRVGRWALEDTYLLWGALMLHIAVRLGYPEDVLDPLTALTAEVDGDLVSNLAAHAAALTKGDPKALAAVSRTFEEMGTDLMAAESGAQAADAYRQEGNTRLANVVQTRALELVEACGGIRTPAVESLTDVLLTPREQEVAFLASGGSSSKQISERLGVSVRTIDNHLSSVYRKLGIGGRDDLPAAFGPRVEGP